MTSLNEKLTQARTGIADDRTAAIVDGLRDVQHFVRASLHGSVPDNGTGNSQFTVTLLASRGWSIGSDMQMTNALLEIDYKAITPTMAALAQTLPASALPCDMVFEVRRPASEDRDVALHHISFGGRLAEPFGRDTESWEKWLSYVIDAEFFIDDLVSSLTDGDETRRVYVAPLPDGRHMRFSAPTREAAAVTLLIREGGLHAIHALTGGMSIGDVIEMHDLFDVELAEVSSTPFAAEIGSALNRLSDLIATARNETVAELQPDH